MSMTYGGSSITFSDGSVQNTAATGFGFKNRILNGQMVIDQRNAGASVTPINNQYSVDRWQFQGSQSSKLTMQQNAGSVTPPAGFINYLGITSSSAYSVLSSDYFLVRQAIEGLNVADLGWGTVNAATVTLSFWVRSSLTGTFGGSVTNNGDTRCYPFNYTISSANTWEQKSITITGDTTGTWLKTNSTGINLYFSMGTGSTYLGTAGAWAGTAYYGATGQTNLVGTNGATFYITGVQLEKGSTATSFDYRPYGTELALCQRYYWKWLPTSTRSYIGTAWVYTNSSYTSVKNPVTMRTTPTLTTSGTASDYGGYSGSAFIASSSVPAMDTSNVDTPLINISLVGASNGAVSISGSATVNGFLGFNAEL